MRIPVVVALLLLAAADFAHAAEARLTLGRHCSDNMVVQRALSSTDNGILLHGSLSKEAHVSVRFDQGSEIAADSSEKTWKLTWASVRKSGFKPQLGTPYTITITPREKSWWLGSGNVAGTPVTLTNVIFGDVWVVELRPELGRPRRKASPPAQVRVCFDLSPASIQPQWRIADETWFAADETVRPLATRTMAYFAQALCQTDPSVPCGFIGVELTRAAGAGTPSAPATPASDAATNALRLVRADYQLDLAEWAGAARQQKRVGRPVALPEPVAPPEALRVFEGPLKSFEHHVRGAMR